MLSDFDQAPLTASPEAFTTSIMALLAAGYITVAEAAEALSVHRSTIYRRCKRAGIDPDLARAQFLRKWIARATRTNWRRPSKQALRAKGHEAVLKWRGRRKSGKIPDF